jgi:hypothetical protein
MRSGPGGSKLGPAPALSLEEGLVSVTDYVIDVLLVAVVLRQVRPHELTVRSALVPLLLLAAASAVYLRSFTLRGNDLVLIVVLCGAGIALGALSGLADRLWHDSGGRLIAQAGAVSVGAWVLGMGFRFAFDFYANHAGARSVVRFSMRHDISGAGIWTAALVLMAFGQVLARVGVLQGRRIRADKSRPPFGYAARSSVGHAAPSHR